MVSYQDFQSGKKNKKRPSRKMTHKEFIKKFNDGQIDILIDKNMSGYFYEIPYLMPRHLRIRLAVLKTIGLTGFITSFILFFFAPWWVATALLFGSLYMFTVCQKSAANGVYEAVLINSQVYKAAINTNILKIAEI